MNTSETLLSELPLPLHKLVRKAGDMAVLVGVLGLTGYSDEVVVQANHLLLAQNLRATIKAGMARNGTQLGRPRLAFPVEEALALRQSGMSYRQIAKCLSRPQASVHRAISGLV